MSDDRGPITRGVLLHILWRSFFFQAANNYERMQNVGFAYCLQPALMKLYEGDALQRAHQRHLDFFNSHPYMANAVLGAVVRLEEDVAAGRLAEERVGAFKTTMMGPLAAIGDSFFWASLKPFAAALAVAGIFSGIPWAPVVFLLLNNLFHVGLRTFGLMAGYRTGERVFEKICQVDLVQFSDRSHYLGGVCLGVGVAALLDETQRSRYALGQGLEFVVLTGLVLIFFQSLKRKVEMPWLLYGFSCLTALLMFGLNSLFPLFP